MAFCPHKDVATLVTIQPINLKFQLGQMYCSAHGSRLAYSSVTPTRSDKLCGRNDFVSADTKDLSVIELRCLDCLMARVKKYRCAGPCSNFFEYSSLGPSSCGQEFCRKCSLTKKCKCCRSQVHISCDTCRPMMKCNVCNNDMCSYCIKDPCQTCGAMFCSICYKKRVHFCIGCPGLCLLYCYGRTLD